MEALMCRNEFDPQDIKLDVEGFKIFEITGHEIPMSSLPIGATGPKWTTNVEELHDMGLLKHKVLAVLMPGDLQKLKQLEREMTLYPSNNTIKEEFNELLMRSSTVGLMQVKDYSSAAKLNPNGTLADTEERKLEVRTISASD